MSRRKKHAEHENLERWLLTYADMITLLMAFFIMLYTMSRVDAAKVKAVGEAARANLGYAVLTTNGPGDNSVLTGRNAAEIPRGPPKFVNSLSQVPPPYRLTVKKLSRLLRREGLLQQVKLNMDARGLVISMVGDAIFFDSGSDQIKPGGKKLLDLIGPMISAVPNPVMVEGHTDEQLQASDQAMANWRLSAARALSVLGYLFNTKYVEGDRLSLSAHAHYRPSNLQAADPEDRRRLERRVDLILVGESPYRTKAAINLVTEDQPSETGWTRVDEVPPSRPSVPNTVLPDR